MQANYQICAMEEEMNALSESAGLFEVNFPDYKQLRACRREVFLLKQLWDMIGVVLSSIEEWKDTLWADINVENMEMECKRFVKEIRGLDKEMRAWDAFSGLDSTVKNMVTSLRAVGELQNPAIRDRHWQQLMQATKVVTSEFPAISRYVETVVCSIPLSKQRALSLNSGLLIFI